MIAHRKIIRVALLILVFGLFLGAGPALAQNVTLAWNPSDSPDVAGYKIYYQADSSELPMEGIEALEGPSPVDAGDVTTFALTGLPEGHTYYFRATAYDSAGCESSLSNLAASAWIPVPLLPESGERASTPVMMVWSAPPAGQNLTFTLLFGTSPNLEIGSAAPCAGGSPPLPPSFNLLAVLGCLAGLALRQSLSPKSRKRLAGLAFCLALALGTASCGGGGGDGGDTSPSASFSHASDTIVVSGLTENYFTADDLEEGATYYWKVIAVDDSGQEFESDTSSFSPE